MGHMGMGQRDEVIPPYKIDSATDEIRRCHAQQRANELRNTVMLRLRRVADLCSSTLSENCGKAEKDTLR